MLISLQETKKLDGDQSSDSTYRSKNAKPFIRCTSNHIHALFGPAVQNNLRVKGDGSTILVPENKEQCGVRSVAERGGRLSFYSQYDGCYCYIKGDRVVVPLEVQVGKDGLWYRVNISCPLSQYKVPEPKMISGTCEMPWSLRVPCGPSGVSADACLKLGCCYSCLKSACYHRIDACSLDGHFVFAVNALDFPSPIFLDTLRIKGHPQCIPVATSMDGAVFKFGVTECGAKRVVLGKVLRYEVEVEAEPQGSNGDSPFRLLVQCVYPGPVRPSWDPTKPPLVSAVASPKVRMRIARDASFSTFVPEEELPLQLSLRSPVHVEVSFTEPSLNRGLSLRLRDCVAFPASRHSLWTLLHDGCPNPLDTERSAVLLGSGGQSPPQARRFDVKTFTFIDPKTKEPSMEELYFFCWVEICTEGEDCEPRCPSLNNSRERTRREPHVDRWSQFVFLGPVLLDQDDSHWAEIHEGAIAGPTATACEMLLVYALCVVCTAGLSLLVIFTGSKVRKIHRPDGDPDSNTEMEVAGSAGG
ncbi:hypothetical protein GJAV_G00226130 [Gymnothorax javanicus]|nr:hypothetical protein GJAV_G00226130 [Gymnothorax javanicus]